MTRVALLQLPAFDGRTLDKALEDVTDAVRAQVGAELVLLPEIWTPGYFDFDSYEKAGDDAPRIIEALSGLAQDTNVYLHGGSIVERDGDRLFNSSLLFDPGGELIGRYRKIHLFGYGSREQELLTPGNDVVTVDTDLGRLGLAVCYDLRFPELFRLMCDQGAIGFLVASAWPHPRVEAWATFLQARAAENQAFMLAVNAVGRATGGAVLCGRSAVVDPWGTVVAAAANDPAVVTADIDFGEAVAARQRFPELVDRRLLEETDPVLVLARDGERPLRFLMRRVVVAGYTARDAEAVRSYVAKLEAEGIAAPEEIPAYFLVGRELVTTASHIDVAGDRTCGEVEFALLVTDDEVYVAAASDHTDRALEEESIPVSKQACPKVISSRVWRYSEIKEHWDELMMEARTPAEADDLYQAGSVATLLHPDDLLERVRVRFGEDLTGTVIFSGTLASLAGDFVFSDSFSAQLRDPVTSDSLAATYSIRDVLGGDGHG